MLASPKLRLIHETFRGVLAAREKREDEVETWLRTSRAETANPRRHSSAAFILVAAGREEEALDELERGLALHDPWLMELPSDPLMASIRSLPRFQRMLEVMGLGSGVPAAP
jgi:hypothetical protein